MISPVHKYIDAYADAGADIITIHPEATDDLSSSIKKIKDLGKKVGVSLNPETKVSIIKDHLEQIDLVLIMSVNPGFGGQKFIDMADKVSALRSMIGDRPVHIEIDGGVDPNTAPKLVEAGADVLVAGSAVFKGGSVNNPEVYGQNMDAIRKSFSV